MTNFVSVTQFNAVMGQGVAQTPSLPSFQQVHLRSSLIEEEAVREFQAAVMSRDLVAIADAIGDSLVVVYGAANDFGLDADQIFKIVHESNMSKLCATEDDAKESVRLYAEGGFHGKAALQASYRPAGDNSGRFVVFDAVTGKTLKGIHFADPVAKLTQLIYPNGIPTEKNPGMKDKALEMLKSGRLSASSYWDACAVMDEQAAGL